MKKALSLILALVMCLSLCACGKDATISNPYEKYSALFDMLEAGKYEDAHSYIDDLADTTEPTATEPTEPEPTEPEPTEPEPQYTTIELTVDNWDTYFEEVAIPQFSKNAFGEVDNFELEYYLQLKEEYYPLLNRDGTSIVIEIAYNYGERVCSVDFENQTYELGERIRTASTTAIADGFYDYDGRFLCSPYGVMVYYDGAVRYYEDTEILRVKGTLCLRVE